MTDERRTAVVGAATDIIRASAWLEQLRGAGIAAEMVGGGMSWVYPAMPTISEYRIIVFEEDEARAREIIARAEAGELALPDEE